MTGCAEVLAARGVVLVCGLPGSGKSTLAVELAERAQCAVVSVDRVKAGRRIPSLQYYAEARALIERHVREGKAVVVDACALSWEYRARLVAGLVVEVGVVWIDCPTDLMRRRRPHIRDWWQYARRASAPTVAEGFAVVERRAAVVGWAGQ